MSRHFNYRSVVDASPLDVWDWHSRPGAFERLVPPWERIQLLSRSGSILTGDRAELKLSLGPFSLRWLAEHLDSERGRGFTDRQVRGPFAHWTHRHIFEPEDADRCRLSDEIEYGLRGGPIADALAGWAVEPKLRQTFAYRHRITAGDLGVHGRYFPDGPRRFLITGSTGLVGSSLVAFLSAGGHTVTRLVRGQSHGPDTSGAATAQWDPAQGLLDAESVSGQDVVVHLAGAGIADGRWTPARKRVIRDSRVTGTELLARALAEAPEKPRVLVCASATGFYGDRGDMELDEGSAGGSGFLADVAREWERASSAAEKAGIRVVHLRFGVVLTPSGGALSRMLPAFRAGIGGPLGDGRQYWSWIGLDDLLAAVVHVSASADLSGPVNAVSPRAPSNAEFTRTLGGVLRRPAIMRVPGAALRLLLGEMGDELLLASTRVRPAKLIASGFEYRYGELESALRHGLGRATEVSR
ncbi:MAG: TIGR01777 family oxidoreductase [Gemmatimonadetes bacterium]|nr:TIGR01777 family oxidoreductase [Gemmatimonadota bacterium]